MFPTTPTPDATEPTVRPSSGMGKHLPPVTSSSSSYSERFGVPTRLGARPVSKAERRVFLRKLTLSQPLVAKAPVDNVAQQWVSAKHQTKQQSGCSSRIASFESELVVELDKIGDCDPYQRLAAHRNAFMRYIDDQDVSTQFFLQRIMNEYEEATVHRFKDRYEDAVRHQDKAERGTRMLEGERKQLLHRIDGLHLQVENLERQLRGKVETLAHISAKHNLQIPASYQDTDHPSTQSRTLTEIVSTQRKLEMKANDEQWGQETSAIEEAMRLECEEAERLLATLPRPSGTGYPPLESSMRPPTITPKKAIPQRSVPAVPLTLIEAQRVARAQEDGLGCELSPHPSLDNDSPRE